MRKMYICTFLTAFLFFVLLPGLQLKAQTTLTTATGTTGYTATNGVTGNSCVTFVIENTNAAPVLLMAMEDYKSASYPSVANPTLTLWYSSTSLSGAVTVGTPDWTVITTTSSVNMVTGYNTIFTNLNFVIPGNTQYRFALQSSSGIAYSGAAANACDPDIISGNGVNLKLGEATVNGSVVGYGGAFPTPPNSPRWFTGSVTIQPAGPCVSPPDPGTITSNANPACSGSVFRLAQAGGSFGLGQTLQWQSSPNGTSYTNISGYTLPFIDTFQTTSTYYRLAVTCGGTTIYTPGLLVTTPALVAGIYTINSAVATGGTNFQTFNDAINYIKCGIGGPVVLNVAASSGPYAEQITIPQIGGASAANSITINGNGRTLNFNSVNSDERAGIKLNGADYVTINNLIINGTGSATTDYNFGIQLINGANFNSITNCVININNTVTSTNYAGIVISGSATGATTAGVSGSNNTITGNTVNGGYYGITTIGAATGLVINNQIRNNQVNDFYLYGIYIGYTTASLVENNDINRRNRTTGISTFYGIAFVNPSESGLVSKNRIHDPFTGSGTATTSSAYAIYFSGADAKDGKETIVSNNLVYNFTNGGIIYAVYNIGSDSIRYYHNTISLEDAAYAGTSTTAGFYQSTTAYGIELKNNIFKIARGGTGSKYCLYFGATGTASTIVSNNNNLIMASTGGTANYTGYRGLPAPAISSITLPDWRSGTGQDVASVDVNSLFTNPAAGNFSPLTAELDNKGTFVGILTDINNAVRNAVTPDIGAYEFTAPLPIKLLSIAASKINTDVLVNWTTAQEINFSHYEVERSTDGTSFVKTGSVLPNGGATLPASYSFNDKNMAASALAKVLYYRLKMIDKDGRYEYSRTVTVALNKETVAMVKAFPSPFVNEIYVQAESRQPATALVWLTDATGRTMLQTRYKIVPGNNMLLLNDLHKLQPGTYLLTVTVGDKRTALKVVK